MMQHEVKCTPNNQCKCIVSNEKKGMLLRGMQNFHSNTHYWIGKDISINITLEITMNKTSVGTSVNRRN